MHACPQSDTFYNKVTKKRKKEKVRESCLLFSPTTHLSPSFFIQAAHLTLSQFHQNIERLRMSRVFRYIRFDFGLLALQQRHVGIATEKEKVCSTLPASLDQTSNSTIRCHGFRRKRGLTSLSENRVVNLKAIPLSTEDGRNARSFIIEIVKEKKSRKTKFNWKEKVNLLSHFIPEIIIKFISSDSRYISASNVQNL